ncbi:M48 family metalloprotease [Gilvimarinus sp. SDUM040013]|uniref:Putative beta-barrel assembly-enhancing protease n=1 Tax=Gilvimarinus gilvus TaxID=3058038 RepID=A0ABU4RYQ6_9GAMM|nr:M48 family metalloprotease [Gilvimarinus sp. SDUM040013]MDO3386308.1 M48 family metalloprotease [Gilvimarinus sp. SDUM040013]MDX6850034.1 M48 family metalloprotease [Gilvimarinus sp. SDUM040013]
MRKVLLATLLFSFSLTSHAADGLNLPDFGDTTSGIVSFQEERRLGQMFLRSYRSQVPTSSDPLLISYLEHLIAKLALYSPLNNRNFDLIVAENSTMNAFAAPGNIIGVHTGLLVHSQSEAQLASVLTHELAHLSQRHYARRLEQQSNMALPFYTALLASLVLAASGDADGGIAAISATQAAAADAQLKFSRQNEQEADRLGIQTLIDAGYDPYAASDMFEQMLRASRYSRRPPDFLLTHPVTESRISDARARAMRYPRRLQADNLEFHLMRSRVRAGQAETPQRAIDMFRGELEGNSLSMDSSQYGLALAYAEAGNPTKARETLTPLLEKEPDRLTYQVMDIDIDIAAERYSEALDKLKTGLHDLPNYYPFNVRYAEVLMNSGRYQSGAHFLSQYVRNRKDDPYLWYLLAEVNGLAGDVLGVHEARAEYFILIGIYDKAILQLRNALKLTKTDYKTALLNERLRYVEKLRADLDRR